MSLPKQSNSVFNNSHNMVTAGSVWLWKACYWLQRSFAYIIYFASYNSNGSPLHLIIELEWRPLELPRWCSGKDLPTNSGDTRDTGAVLIPGSGRSPGGGHGNPLQYSCLEDSVERGSWWATVHGITKSHTQWSRHTHTETIKAVI